MLKGYFLSPARAILDDLANLFTLAGFALAFYAVANPGTVSEFLEEIAAASQESAQSLENIDASSEDTAENTGLLAAEIPTWLQLDHFSLGVADQQAFLGIELCNPANSAFRVQSLSFSGVIQSSGSRVDGEIFDFSGLVIPPRECYDTTAALSIPNAETIDLCITASNISTDQTFREIRRYGFGGGTRGLGTTGMEKLVGWDFDLVPEDADCLEAMISLE